MILLNLLPPEERRLIASQQTLRKIVSWGSFSLVLILIFWVLLSSTWWFLSIQLKSIETIFEKVEESQQGKAFGEFKKEIDKINQKLKYFDNLQAQAKNYSFALEHLTELVPAGIRFTRISINQKTVSLEGHAQTREILISFKKSLENSPYFEKIDSPLSNFLKQTDINFTFSFQIK